MEYQIPKKGEIYRHFKGNLYEIITIARDSETLEEKVVYKEADGDAAYVRPLRMFVSPVDKEKYPDVTQEFRFERVQDASPEILQDKSVQNYWKQDDVCSAKPSMILEYLDLYTVEEKLSYLLRVKDSVTEEFLQVVAQSLDFTENEGSLMERYDEILRYLQTVAKYESGRLR